MPLFDDSGNLLPSNYYHELFGDIAHHVHIDIAYDTKVIDALIDHYKGSPGFKSYFDISTDLSDKCKYNRHLLVFDKTIILCLRASYYGMITDPDIYTASMWYDGDSNRLHEYMSVMKPFIREPKPENKLNLVVRNRHSDTGFSLKNFEISDVAIDVNKHYNSCFLATHTLIDEFLSNERSGLVILHGKQGTGKTSYIRHIIKHCDKRVIYISGDIARELATPHFVQFMIENTGSVIVLEDCEELLAARNGSGHINSGLINILNMSDGLLGDAMKMKFICTFNAPLKDIDKALLRKGRLIARYEFEDLEADKVNAIIEEGGLDIPLQTTPISLAELYNYEKPSFESKRKSIGF